MSARRAVTIGFGSRNDVGRTVVLDPDDPVGSLAAELEKIGPDTREAWVAPCEYVGADRENEKFMSGAGVFVDVDYVDANEERAELPEPVFDAVVWAAGEGGVHANAMYRTNRGARFLTLVEEPVTDAERWRRVALGVHALIKEDLRAIGLFEKTNGLQYDSDDGGHGLAPAAMMFTNRTSVFDENGALRSRRDWPVRIIATRLFDADELASHAPSSDGPRRVVGIDGEVHEPRRHTTLGSLMGTLSAKGVRGEALFQMGMAANLNIMCPPKPEPEVRRWAEWFTKKDAGKDAKKPGPKDGEPPNLERFSSIAIGMHDFLKKPVEKPVGLLGEGVFSAGQIAVLVGRGEAGKSYLALILGRCMARGESFLGIPTPVGGVKVGILELEDHQYFYQKRLASIAAASGGSDELDNRLEIVTRPDLQNAVQANDQATIDALVHWVGKSELKLLIVDALKDAHTADENSNQQMAELMDAFAQICNRAECAVLVLHNEPKPSSDGRKRDDQAAVRGAATIDDKSRCTMRIKKVRGELRQLVFAKVSHGAKPSPIYLLPNKETGLLTVIEAPEKEGDANRAKVLATLIKLGTDGAKTKAMAKDVGLSESTVKTHLNALEGDGKARRTGEGKDTLWWPVSAEGQSDV